MVLKIKPFLNYLYSSLQIGSFVTENSECAVVISFHNVPLKVDAEILPKLKEVLASVTPDTFDLRRMRTVVHRRKLRSWASIENSPHSEFGSDVIGYMLFGRSFSDVSSTDLNFEHVETKTSRKEKRRM